MIIATRFYDGQGLGNQLWVYAAARSIAEYLGAGFVQLDMDKFKGKDFLDIDPFYAIDEIAAQKFINEEISVFHERRYYDGDLGVVSSGFDERVKNLDKSVELEGLFQSEAYFFGDLGKLNQYFPLKKGWESSTVISEETCILNIRGGEYKRHKNLILPRQYWENAIEHMRCDHGIQHFLMVTDDIAYAKALFPQFDVLRGGVGESYAALNSAKWLVLSNSSFGYFPVKTNPNTPYVIAPRYWARFDNPYQRWASPANLYQDWMWLDGQGDLHGYQDLEFESAATEKFYQDSCYLATMPEAIYKKTLLHYIPSDIKRTAKKMLAKVLPMKFG